MNNSKKFVIKEVISINGHPYKGSLNISDTAFTVIVSDFKGGKGTDSFPIKYQSDNVLRMKRILHNESDVEFNKI